MNFKEIVNKTLNREQTKQVQMERVKYCTEPSEPSMSRCGRDVCMVRRRKYTIRFREELVYLPRTNDHGHKTQVINV